MVVIMVAMVVAPRPIFLLFLGTKPAKVAIAVAVGLVGPAVVVHDLVIVPHVIVGVVRIVDAVSVMLTRDSCQRRRQRRCQQERSQRVRSTAHVFSSRIKKHS